MRAWPCVVRALWCASAGFHLPVPWQPLPVLIKNIPWNFLTLPRPRHHFAHIHTLTRMFMFVTQSPMICRYLSPKRAVTVKSPHVVLFVLESEPLWICLLKVDFYAYVLMCRPIIAHCAGRLDPCVLQSLVVLWCRSDD